MKERGLDAPSVAVSNKVCCLLFVVVVCVGEVAVVY